MTTCFIPKRSKVLWFYRFGNKILNIERLPPSSEHTVSECRRFVQALFGSRARYSAKLVKSKIRVLHIKSSIYWIVYSDEKLSTNLRTIISRAVNISSEVSDILDRPSSKAGWQILGKYAIGVAGALALYDLSRRLARASIPEVNVVHTQERLQVSSKSSNQEFASFETRYLSVKDTFQNGYKFLATSNPFDSNVRKKLGWTEESLLEKANSSHTLCGFEWTKLVQIVRDKISNSTHYSEELKKIYIHRSDKELVTRLLTKRPLSYYLETDKYLLRNGTEGSGNENYLNDINGDFLEYLHPDEAVLSSYFGMHLPSFIVNTGKKYNRGKEGIAGEFVKHAFVAGMVGARMEAQGQAEWYVLVKDSQPNNHNLFQESVRMHLEDVCITVNIKHDETDYVIDGTSISGTLYSARTFCIMYPFFKSALEHEKPVRLQITGLGLGNWSGGMGEAATICFLNGLYQVLVLFLRKKTTSIKQIVLFNMLDDVGDYADRPQYESILSICENNGITLLVNQDFEVGAFDTKFNDTDNDVFHLFAWDGMSYLGNELYLGNATGSMDPATTVASTIAFLGHPLINPEAYKRFEYSANDD